MNYTLCTNDNDMLDTKNDCMVYVYIIYAMVVCIYTLLNSHDSKKNMIKTLQNNVDAYDEVIEKLKFDNCQLQKNIEKLQNDNHRHQQTINNLYRDIDLQNDYLTQNHMFDM